MQNIKNINITRITFTRAIATMTLSAMDLIVVCQVKNNWFHNQYCFRQLLHYFININISLSPSNYGNESQARLSYWKIYDESGKY